MVAKEKARGQPRDICNDRRLLYQPTRVTLHANCLCVFLSLTIQSSVSSQNQEILIYLPIITKTKNQKQASYSFYFFGEMTSKHPDVAGEPTQTGTALLETATAAIQGFGPINHIHQHLCA